MISFLRIILLFLLFSGASGISAQQAEGDNDDVYGLNPVLYNGRLYTFNTPLNTSGNQYFSQRQFETGSVTLRGVTFTDLLLNYDIYNQQLIIKYKIKTGAASLITVSDAWLEAFSINGLNFKIFTTQDTVKRIYQELGSGPIYILYYWNKTLKLDNSYGATNLTFSKAIKERNLLIGNDILPFRNNRSFFSLFDLGKRLMIKEYLRQHKINVRKAVDQKMTELMFYCNTLY